MPDSVRGGLAKNQECSKYPYSPRCSVHNRGGSKYPYSPLRSVKKRGGSKNPYSKSAK